MGTTQSDLQKCNSERDNLRLKYNTCIINLDTVTNERDNYKICKGTQNYYTNLYNDKLNCGVCENACTSGHCKNGICILDYTNDNTKCGTSTKNISCANNQQCINSICYPQNPIIISYDQVEKFFNFIDSDYKKVFSGQIAFAGSNIPSVPLLTGLNRKILSIEIINYKDDDSLYIGSFIPTLSSLISLERSVLLDKLKPDWSDFCNIQYLHLKYKEFIYEIKVQMVNCSMPYPSNVALRPTSV